MTNSEIAKILDKAAQKANPVPQMAEKNNISLKDAYEIQREIIARRKERGEKVTGFKLGFTSRAKMEQMGVHDLIWGILTDEMKIKTNETVSMNKWIHPRAEPEIAFRVSSDITKELTFEELPLYLDGMAPALEIIDSRYENFKFSLEDVVADNCSSTGYALGDWQNLDTEMGDLKISLLINDEERETGSASDILDNPLNSVIELSRLASRDGITVKKGHIILAGAATAAVFLKQGQKVAAKIEYLGTTGFEVK